MNSKYDQYKEINIQIHLVKCWKTKTEKKILKAGREKWLMKYKGTSVVFIANFSSEVIATTRQRDGRFQVMKEN